MLSYDGLVSSGLLSSEVPVYKHKRGLDYWGLWFIDQSMSTSASVGGYILKNECAMMDNSHKTGLMILKKWHNSISVLPNVSYVANVLLARTAHFN